MHLVCKPGDVLIWFEVFVFYEAFVTLMSSDPTYFNCGPVKTHKTKSLQKWYYYIWVVQANCTELHFSQKRESSNKQIHMRKSLLHAHKLSLLSVLLLSEAQKREKISYFKNTKLVEPNLLTQFIQLFTQSCFLLAHRCECCLEAEQRGVFILWRWRRGPHPFKKWKTDWLFYYLFFNEMPKNEKGFSFHTLNFRLRSKCAMEKMDHRTEFDFNI